MTDPTIVSNPDLAGQVAQLNATMAQLAQFSQHVGTGAMTAHVIEWLKTRPSIAWFWNGLSNRGKVIAGLLAAALPAAGISFTFQHPADATGTYVFTFAGVSAATAGRLVWSLAQNWVFQQGWYQSVIKPKPVAGVPVVAGEVPPQPVVVQGVRS